ncbi:oligopeptide-binding protein AppA precursor [Clostridium puniceum]|uniref:Oligopeptide-binding protein AppA n=1 Tax=Clostridium puniceum TaxID=29367 RepID=A0A1S8TVZ1_9CLOT|nr:ABC transporter substrate-binding protein [Clostridium puniceum]OOM81881.1 oligopeptide-binding protein AppA precursor [Clostridium puniceum]
MKFKKLLVTLSVILAVSMLAGCGQGASTTTATNGGEKTAEKTDLSSKIVTTYEAKDMSKNPDAAKNRKDTLIIGTTAPDGLLNALYLGESAYDAYIIEAMYAPLMAPTKNGEIEDWLTESHSVSEDGLTYTFKIKKDANWSDGTPITAKDIEFSIRVCCDSSYTGSLDYTTGRVKIKGSADYKAGKATSISGMKIVDDKNISITLDEKSSSALYVLGGTVPVPEAYYSKYYKQGNTDGLKETYTRPGPASGPYKFVNYKEGQEVDLEANDKCVLGVPKVKNLIYKVCTDDTKVSMLQSGDIDLTDVTVGTDNVESLEGLGFAGYQLFPTNGYGYMAFNEAKPQFKDKAVRQALATALNREKIASSVYNKYAHVINVPQSQVSWVYAEGKNDYKYDLEKAKKMLDDAGWKEGSDGIREKDGVKLAINFTGTSNNPVVDSILSVATEDWKTLGVKFTSEKMDFTSMRQKQKGGDWDMLFMAWSLIADPNDMDIYSTKGSQNKTNYSNPKLDEIYKKISAELDKDKLKELYKELYTEINEDLPYIYMYQRSDMWGYNGRVKGLETSPYVDYTYNLQKIILE